MGPKFPALLTLLHEDNSLRTTLRKTLPLSRTFSLWPHLAPHLPLCLCGYTLLMPGFSLDLTVMCFPSLILSTPSWTWFILTLLSLLLALTSLDPSPAQGYYSVISPHNWSRYCGCTDPHNGKEFSHGNGL